MSLLLDFYYICAKQLEKLIKTSLQNKKHIEYEKYKN